MCGSIGFGSTSTQCVGPAYVLPPDRWIVHLSTATDVGEQMERFAVGGGLTTLLSGRWPGQTCVEETLIHPPDGYPRA